MPRKRTDWGNENAHGEGFKPMGNVFGYGEAKGNAPGGGHCLPLSTGGYGAGLNSGTVDGKGKGAGSARSFTAGCGDLNGNGNG